MSSNTSHASGGEGAWAYWLGYAFRYGIKPSLIGTAEHYDVCYTLLWSDPYAKGSFFQTVFIPKGFITKSFYSEGLFSRYTNLFKSSLYLKVFFNPEGSLFRKFCLFFLCGCLFFNSRYSGRSLF